VINHDNEPWNGRSHQSFTASGKTSAVDISRGDAADLCNRIGMRSIY
jgi:hypothetical protein